MRKPEESRSLSLRTAHLTGEPAQTLLALHTLCNPQYPEIDHRLAGNEVHRLVSTELTVAAEIPHEGQWRTRQLCVALPNLSPEGDVGQELRFDPRKVTALVRPHRTRPDRCTKPQ